MPDTLANQAEALRNARDAAAQGALALNPIPLLADPQNLHTSHKLHWTLRFPLPAASQKQHPTFLLCAPKMWATRPPSGPSDMPAPSTMV